MASLRVVILSAFLTPFRSGAEACVEEVPPKLRDRFDFLIVTAKLRADLPREDALPDGTPVRRVGFGHPIDKWLFPFLAPLAARKARPRIIHAVLESYAGLALMFCRWIVPSARRVLTCQSTNTSFLVRRMHRCAHRVTVISKVLLDRAARFGRGDAVLIPNGIPFERMRAECDRTPKVPGRILYVGRLEPMKGVDTLLQALRLVQEGSGGGPLDAHIVGDGSLRTLLEAQSRSFLSDGTFLGFLPPAEAYREFAEAEIFVGLSRSEALGNVFLEAQAAGCAVVATTVGGIPDIVTDGVTGLLVSPDHPQSAAFAIRRVLAEPALRRRLTENGVQNASRYDWQGIAERYAAVYDTLLP